MKGHFGIPVAWMYVSKSPAVASTYPMQILTAPISRPNGTYLQGVQGGKFISPDGTLSMRAIILVLSNPHRQIWHKGSNQSCMMTDDVFITHVMLYAVAPDDRKNSLLVRARRQVLGPLSYYSKFPLHAV
jgi:hypothetical protein